MSEPFDVATTRATLFQRLRALIRRSRLQILIVRAAEAILILFTGLVIAAGLQQIFPLPNWVRELVFDVLVAFAFARLLPAVATLMRSEANYVAAAELWERRQPQLQQRLSTWVSCNLRGERSAWLDELGESMVEQLQIHSSSSRVPLRWGPTCVRCGLAVGAILTTILLTHAYPAFFETLLPPWR